tara:strand:+ start:756 stop:980 length:225 start_codon:yes stop_codon:yes gene_type:complete
MKIIKEYQILIGLLVIALAIYLGLTTTSKRDYVYPRTGTPKPGATPPVDNPFNRPSGGLKIGKAPSTHETRRYD